MSKLLGFSGKDDFCPGGIYTNPKEAGLLLSLGHHADVLFPPRKRSRISAPFIFSGGYFEKEVSINVLPDECLFEIFKRIPGGEERSACACVSKRWLNVLSNINRDEFSSNTTNQSFKSQDEVSGNKAEDQEVEGCGYLSRSLEGKKATDVRLAAIAVGTASRGGLGKLMIHGNNSVRGVTNLGLKAISHGCPSLRVLSLWNMSSIGDEGLCEIANRCRLLEKLDLSRCPAISDKGLIAIAKKCPNLTDVSLESCSNIGNEGLQAIGQCCPNLKSISIKNCHLVGDQGIASLLSSISYVLTKVKLQALTISDVSLGANSGDFRSLEQVLDRMKCERRVFIEKSFILMFRAYGKAHLPNKAVELFYRMVDEFQCRRTVKSFNSVLNVIIQEGHYSHALEFYSCVVGNTNINISPNVLSYNLVIKAMCKFGLVDRAVEMFREMPSRNCTPDVFTFCTLMDGLCKDNRIDEAVFLLDEMQIEGCLPSSMTFNVLINALCKKGDLARAAKLVDNMFLKGSVPNEVTYNTLIHGLCLKGKLDKAVSLLDRMVSNKCVPNDVTYGTIINGLVKQGRAVDGAQVLISMEERGCHANEYIYSVLVSGLFKEGKFDDAMTLWKEMMEKGCKPNTVVYSALIDGLCREGKPDEAKEVFCEMVSNGCLPNSFTYSSLMRGFFQTGRSKKAILLWNEMENKNFMRNEVCYSVLIHGLCKDGQLKEALMAWQKMLGSGHKPDVVAYSLMIHGLCNDGLVEQGLKLFNEMLSQEPECQPDVITYNILFDAICKQSNISLAIHILNRMMDRGCDPDLVTCDIFLRTLREKLNPPQDGREFLNELVVRLLKQQRIVGASQIVEVMLKKYLPPKASVWTKVVQELCKPKKVRAAIDKCWSNLYF